MSLKKVLKLNIIVIFLLSFLTHFIYKIIPIDLFAIFFPVNESIFEHMKMIYTTYLIDSIILFLLFKKYNIKFNNFFGALFLSSIISITSFLIIWLPIYYRIGENLLITLIILLISIFLSQIASYYILTSFKNNILNYIAFGFVILFIILFAYFTYYPLHNDFFLDPLNQKYGTSERPELVFESRDDLTHVSVTRGKEAMTDDMLNNYVSSIKEGLTGFTDVKMENYQKHDKNFLFLT